MAANILKKIAGFEEVVNELESLRRSGKTVVHCHGVFDLLHPGHIRHLAAAKQQGDVLVVTTTTDAYVNKGPGRPVFNEALRAEVLASLDNVDYVIVSPFPSAVQAILKIRPDVYVKGSDYANPSDDITGNIVEEKNAVEANGGRLHFTDEITFSSSNLINNYFSPFTLQTRDWLGKLKEEISPERVNNLFDKISNMNVLVIGEIIIDEYVFCSSLGKVAKDPILAFKNLTEETILGGAGAIANHLGDFAKSVELLSLIGGLNGREKFIRDSLHTNVELHLVENPAVPTICKRRFVDNHTGAKLFEIYFMDEEPLSEEAHSDLLKLAENRIKAADLVIVADYGHGMMEDALIRIIEREAKFFALNTQANAGNRGLNPLHRYRHADYICLAGNELENESRLHNSNYEAMIERVTRETDCDRFTITLGREGSIHFDDRKEVCRAPALASQVVDRVGAGDAVLSITSMLVAASAPWDVVAMVGNAAGAELVGQLGNRRSLSKSSFIKHLGTLLK